MKELIELRPNRDLIDNDFNGYKLSLENIPTYEKLLDYGVDQVHPSANQFSYAHVRIFSLQNYLHVNPHAPQLLFFVDERWHVMQVSMGLMNRVDSISSVCEIPGLEKRQEGAFPVSLHFPAADRAVISDGTGTFHVAAIKKGKWMIIFTDALPKKGVLQSTWQHNGCLLMLSREVLGPDSILHLLLFDENWQTVSSTQIKVYGNIDYGAFESHSTLLLITQGRKSPQFLTDNSGLNEAEKPKYRWTQTAEDLTIVFDVAGVENSRLCVLTEQQNLEVLIEDQIVVKGPFAGEVTNVTWNIEHGALEVLVVKKVSGESWNQAIEGDDTGVQFQKEVQGEQPQVNVGELEDVDLTTPATLFRLCLNEKKIKHEVDLSTQQYLFSVTTDPSKGAAICIRHLTDACVWQFETDNSGQQPTSQPDNTGQQMSYRHTHTGTFSAFGYVQASKTHKKFIVAPTTLSYVVIADEFTHLYIFRQPSPVNGTLRNRKTGVRVNAIGKQHLVNLQCDDAILGIQASDDVLFILTNRKFFTLAINNA